jgi:signal transduction histidine kinase
MKSLQARLGTGLLISLVTLFSVQWLVVSSAIRYLTEDYISTRLQHDISNLLTALQVGPDGKITIPSNRIDPIFQRPFSGHYFKLISDNFVIRSRSLWDYDIDIPALPVGDSQRLYLKGPQNQPLLMLIIGYHKQDRDITIAVGEDMTSIESDIKGFQVRYAVTSFIILSILIILQVMIVRAGLRPLEKVRRELHLLEQGRTQHIGTDVPAEVLPLVNETNRLLHIMGQRLVRSRNALGNLAHALKTPLTLLTQLASRREISNQAEIRDELLQHTGTVRGIIERELKRARLAGAISAGQQFKLDEEIKFLVQTLNALYRDKALQIDCNMEIGATYAIDREDMLELFGNLLDNACKWARKRVLLTVKPVTDLSFTIEDDGPGCPDEELAGLTNRGVRLDEQTAGHGLGLAIVKDVVQNYSGDIRFGRSQHLGGFLVDVHIPLAGELV